jgi:hypothetical protein
MYFPPPTNSYLSLLLLYNLDESLVAGYGPEGPPDHHLFRSAEIL